ncbi:glycoside hydrolase family 28 protein [Cercophora scortea]|uniref:endo-polygalacturonase n=1 Tax=Cercophora scortea TaxID=314031 RepID=A0AAE0M5J3_9PEZI|nr:glycoside hydrolase family 28 protein [Cercophora scortea]
MKNAVLLTSLLSLGHDVVAFGRTRTPWRSTNDTQTWPSLNDTQPCTFTGSTGYSLLKASNRSCTDIVLSDLSVPAGVTLDLRNLRNGASVTFQGETSWGYSEWAGPLVSISGTNITVKGAPGSLLNGSGDLYWDGEGQGGKTKPKFFQARLIDSTISDISILNAPVHVFSINNSRNLKIANVIIDNLAGDGLAKNTDGFDISQSSNIEIEGATVMNQDDCVAINSGSNIVFRDGICIGGHGLSVGSIGGRSDNTVDNVLFDNSVIINSQNGIRIKTKHSTNGTVSNVAYRNIGLSYITDYGIVVDQSYGAKTLAPTNGVSITNFTLENVSGTMMGDGLAIFVRCGEGSCADWTWAGVNVVGGQRSTECTGLPAGIEC